jgi:DNA-directed RNA polymerase subunit beta'
MVKKMEEIKKINNWIYVQSMTTTKKKCFVFVRPAILYEIPDNIHLVKGFQLRILVVSEDLAT